MDEDRGPRCDRARAATTGVGGPIREQLFDCIRAAEHEPDYQTAIVRCDAFLPEPDWREKRRAWEAENVRLGPGQSFRSQIQLEVEPQEAP